MLAPMVSQLPSLSTRRPCMKRPSALLANRLSLGTQESLAGKFAHQAADQTPSIDAAAALKA